MAIVRYNPLSELRSMQDVPLIEEQETDAEQLKLAKSLVDSMSTTLEKIELTNKYNEALREVIDAKIEGKEIVTVEEEETPIIDIMTALKDSIKQAKTTKEDMVKAKGKTAAKSKKKAAGK